MKAFQIVAWQPITLQLKVLCDFPEESFSFSQMLQNTAMVTDLQRPDKKIFVRLGWCCKIMLTVTHRLAKTSFWLGLGTGGGF